MMSRNCPICQRSPEIALHVARFVVTEDIALPNEYLLVQCKNCSFVYADTPATAEDYAHYYRIQSTYAAPTVSSGSGTHGADLAKLQGIANRIANFLPNRNASVLDVGCGNGGLLRELLGLGFHQISGLDPSPLCVANTAAISPAVSAYCGDLTTFVPEHPYDAVVLSGVLEHLVDLLHSAEQITRLVQPGGVLHIEVPDAEEYYMHERAPYQQINLEHINHFSPAHIQRLFGAHGFACTNVYRYTQRLSKYVDDPILSMTFQKSSSVTSFSYAGEASLLPERMDLYLQRSAELMNQIEFDVRAAFSENDPLIVWGTGQLLSRLLTRPVFNVSKVLAFTDGNPVHHEKFLAGQRILPPHALHALDQQIPILVASVINQEQIADDIRNKYRLTNPLRLLKLR